MDLLISPESRLISRVLYRPKELDDLELRGFDPEVLPLPYAVAFAEIIRVRQKHNEMPSVPHLQKVSPGVQILDKCPAKKATLYWDQVYRSRWRGELTGRLIQLNQLLPSDTPAEALKLDLITEKATEIFSEMSAKYAFDSGRPATLNELVSLVRRDYEKLEAGEAVGVPIPFEFLQAELVGWKVGRIYVVAGRPKTGKSWFALICAAHAMVKGTKVLFVSLEMTQEELSKRMACLLGGISYNRVVKGKLDAKERKKYFAVLKDIQEGEIGKMIKIVGPGQAKTPEAIGALAKTFGAALVVVDAFYHGMEHQKGDQGWEQIRSLMRRYRSVSLTSSAAWMLTTQFNRQQKGRGSATLQNLAFGDAIGMDANGMVYLVRDSYLKSARQVDIILGEAREADDIQAFRYNWNFITMDYSLVGVVQFGEDGSNPFG